MNDYEIIAIRERPELLERAAKWFHEKWGIPEEAYLESMREALAAQGPVPAWYVAMGEGGIAGGVGVIENDFHDRKDLAPNICAVYVEEAHRRRGLAGKLLDRACADLARAGVKTVYLLTDHTGFYERYGWEFFCMAQGDGEEQPARMYVHRWKDPAAR